MTSNALPTHTILANPFACAEDPLPPPSSPIVTSTPATMAVQPFQSTLDPSATIDALPDHLFLTNWTTNIDVALSKLNSEAIPRGFTMVKKKIHKADGWAELVCWKGQKPKEGTERSAREHCPFSIVFRRTRGRPSKNADWEARWRREQPFLKYKDRHHNHGPNEPISMPVARRISYRAERDNIIQLRAQNMLPSQILNVMVQKGVLIRLHDIQNILRGHDLATIGNHTVAEAAITFLSQYKIPHTVWADNYNRFEGMAIATPQACSLAEYYPDVFMMDCTYRTNVHKWPCFHIAGKTGVGSVVDRHSGQRRSSIFTAMLAIFQSENHRSYVAGLKAFKRMVLNGKSPKVIITDRDQKLKTAIAVVFPESRHMYCQWHIWKNICEHKAGIASEDWNELEQDYSRDVVHAKTANDAREGIRLLNAK